MRAPRRVPWSSKAELAELYELLFAPTSDITAKQQGLARMHVYISSPSCPAFLPLLHSLFTASLLSPPGDAAEAMSVRMTCGMAIVRFVNGMVDPLQTGPYARPISHIAASLGIPPLLISIRHRATHEDLPPLPLLLHCISIAIDYLHHQAFLPMLASTSDVNGNGGRRVGETEILIKRWKGIMKIRMREKEVGEENETGRGIRAVKRDLEVLEPEDVVWALCGSNGLVPLARKKRPGYNTNTPPLPSLHLWAALVQHLAEIDPQFTNILAEHIVSILAHPPNSPIAGAGDEVDLAEQKKEVQSFRWCLATWLLWLWKQEGVLALGDEEKNQMVKTILTGLLQGDEALRRLYKELSKLYPAIAPIDRLLIEDPKYDEDSLQGLEVTDELVTQGNGNAHREEIVLSEMEKRLRVLESRRTTKQTGAIPRRIDASKIPSAAQELPPGWRILGRPDPGRERPIGLWIPA